MEATAKFRDIKERTFEFALAIVNLCRSLDETPGVGRTLSRQLIRSGTSIGANVQEAQAGQSRADFISKYSIALKEARETIFWLRLLDKSGFGFDGQCKQLAAEAEEISRVIGSIIVKARKSQKR